MARLSASSAAKGNGHPTPPATAGEPSTTSASKHEDKSEDSDFDLATYAARTKALPYDPSLLPSGSRSLSSIAVQSFWLGFTLAACLMLTAWLALEENRVWRLPAFFACLSLFHFLEFWTTARFNVPAARASSFLLFNNGMAYNIAHTLAALEVITSSFFPFYQTLLVNNYTVAIGIALVAIGQLVRSIAMATAGTNFNHTPAKVYKEGHELVTTGVYAWFRHPSYFGFFWWALGTQVLVGNKVCFVGYLCALWTFFSRRIVGKCKSSIAC